MEYFGAFFSQKGFISVLYAPGPGLLSRRPVNKEVEEFLKIGKPTFVHRF